MIIGRSLINEYYEDEKLYSTGDDYLDDLLERAFCEGYEYAQREFAEEEEEEKKKAKRKNIAKKVAIGTGIAAGTIGALYGGSKLAQRISKNRQTEIGKKLNSGNLDETESEMMNRLAEKLNRRERIAKKISDPVEKGAKAVGDAAKKTGKFVKETAGKVKNKINGKKGE